MDQGCSDVAKHLEVGTDGLQLMISRVITSWEGASQGAIIIFVVLSTK